MLSLRYYWIIKILYLGSPEVWIQIRCRRPPHRGPQIPARGTRRGRSEGRVLPSGGWWVHPQGAIHRRQAQRLPSHRHEERTRSAPSGTGPSSHQRWRTPRQHSILPQSRIWATTCWCFLRRRRLRRTPLLRINVTPFDVIYIVWICIYPPWSSVFNRILFSISIVTIINTFSTAFIYYYFKYFFPFPIPFMQVSLFYKRNFILSQIISLHFRSRFITDKDTHFFINGNLILRLL